MRHALLLTGAAARISQEVALIDQLIDNYQLELSPETTYLAGYSSGALNISAINACFRQESPLSWNDFYKNEILFKINTEEIIIKKKNLPFDTSPLRKKIEDFTLLAGFNRFCDLPFSSSILVFSIRKLSVIWAEQPLTQHGHALLTDLLMASSAMPLLFPEQEICAPPGLKTGFPAGSYTDGGTTGTFVHFKDHLKKQTDSHGPFDKLFIVSPMREITPEDFDEFDALLPVNDNLKQNIKELKVFQNFLSMISMNGFDSFIHQFYHWILELKRPVAQEILVCIPELEKNFPILDFDQQFIQYQAVNDWAIRNPHRLAIPLENYVLELNQRQHNK